MIQTAKYYNLGPNDALVTVATDSIHMYQSEMPQILEQRFGGRFDQVSAAEAFGRYMLAAGTENFLEASHVDKKRMFNLGYYTWVEQQGVSVEDFESRRKQQFWDELRPLLKQWDVQILQFNHDIEKEALSRKSPGNPHETAESEAVEGLVVPQMG